MTTVFFDLETDGLGPEAQIIQIGAVAMRDGETVSEFEVKLHFQPREGQDAALALNHYDPAVWAMVAKDTKLGLVMFADFLNDHADVKKVSERGWQYWVARLAGHNVTNFDFPLLLAAFKRVGQFLPADLGCVQDTLELAKWLDIPVPNRKLGTLAVHFGVAPPDGAHDALVDARTAAQLAVKLLERIS